MLLGCKCGLVLRVIVMEPEFSDHSPLSVSLDDRQHKSVKPFKFFNCLTQYSEFKILVQQKWSRGITASTSPLVWQKLNALKMKMKLKQLNTKELLAINNKIAELRGKLKILQRQMEQSNDHQMLCEEEKSLKLELENGIELRRVL
ncbi:hypothetical protein R3W88_011330 [Solanum pinnatisectum]|uniref:Uncharacterized protein n=1 Tax=Solanum pinnatisectum TaxID=50273 RepID=A0AAV9L6Y2_9SOLN|nr:hypothetical protein R3W88_011330 [Solanum pinnatisectum]